jgi:hypothetical protein
VPSHSPFLEHQEGDQGDAPSPAFHRCGLRSDPLADLSPHCVVSCTSGAGSKLIGQGDPEFLSGAYFFFLGPSRLRIRSLKGARTSVSQLRREILIGKGNGVRTCSGRISHCMPKDSAWSVHTSDPTRVERKWVHFPAPDRRPCFPTLTPGNLPKFREPGVTEERAREASVSGAATASSCTTR